MTIDTKEAKRLRAAVTDGEMRLRPNRDGSISLVCSSWLVGNLYEECLEGLPALIAYAINNLVPMAERIEELASERASAFGLAANLDKERRLLLETSQARERDLVAAWCEEYATCLPCGSRASWVLRKRNSLVFTLQRWGKQRYTARDARIPGASARAARLLRHYAARLLRHYAARIRSGQAPEWAWRKP